MGRARYQQNHARPPTVEKRRKARGSLTHRFKQLGAGVLSDVSGDRKRSVGTRPFGVYAALRNVFTVEVSELLDQMEIVEQQRATRASRTGSSGYLQREHRWR